MTTYKGKTEDAKSPILGAEFWREGIKIAGKVMWAYPTVNGICYALKLFKPVDLNGEPVDQVSIGGLRGFHMALQAAGLTKLNPGHQVYIECTGTSESKKKGHSPMINFEIEVQEGEPDGEF